MECALTGSYDVFADNTSRLLLLNGLDSCIADAVFFKLFNHFIDQRREHLRRQVDECLCGYQGVFFTGKLLLNGTMDNLLEGILVICGSEPRCFDALCSL